MGEHYIEREILIRLQKVENELALKNDQITDLQYHFTTRLEESEKYLRNELLQRDDIIKELTYKVHRLASEINANTSTPSDENEPQLDVINTPITPSLEKKQHDLLVIGDSIIKHCRGDVINPGKDTVIACHPGARAEKIEAEFKKLIKHNTYDKIIVHCGINFVPQYSPTYVSDKIVDLLEIVKSLAPTSNLAFSGLLPKIGPQYLPGINTINNNICRASNNTHSAFKFIHHRNYFIDRKGSIESAMFCRSDGIHLSKRGVGALERSLHDFVKQ